MEKTWSGNRGGQSLKGQSNDHCILAMSKHISEEKFQELGIVQLPAQELVVRVGEMFLQVLGHPKALLTLGAEDRLHSLVGSEPLPVLLVLVSGRSVF